MVKGEGILSLGYAFLYTGARSAVVAPGNLISNIAVEYMISFYRYRKKGYTKAEALNMAKRKMKEKYKIPYYWASFILYGGNGNFKR